MRLVRPKGREALGPVRDFLPRDEFGNGGAPVVQMPRRMPESAAHLADQVFPPLRRPRLEGEREWFRQASPPWRPAAVRVPV